MSSYLYIIKCYNNALYTGITNDLKHRYMEHLAGKGSKYCRAFKVKNLVAAWHFSVEKHELLALEIKLKKEHRDKKLTLVQEPESFNDYVEQLGLNLSPQRINISQFLKDLCPCFKQSKCNYFGRCDACISVHLTKVKKPPECFKLRPRWVKSVARNFNLENIELLDNQDKS